MATIFETQHFDTAEGLLTALTPHNLGPEKDFLWDRGDLEHWIFRGQSEATWRLQPSAFRENAFVPFIAGQLELKLSPLQSVVFEELVAKQFASGAMRRGFDVPDEATLRRRAQTGGDYRRKACAFPPDDQRGIYAIAQHYGIPTRLLDWTTNPMVAAYFAGIDVAKRTIRNERTRDDSDERMAVWALNRLVVSHYCGDWSPGAELVIAPASNIPNLRAQGGLFTLVRLFATDDANSENPLPSLEDLIQLHETEIRDGLKVQFPNLPLLYKFTLPHSQARRLLYFLHLGDIHAATLYPTLESVRDQIAEGWYRTATRPGRE